MEKRRIKNDIVWIEVKTLGPRVDCFYGLRNGTNIHGHTVLSGCELIHQRPISGANLTVSGSVYTVSTVSGDGLVLCE